MFSFFNITHGLQRIGLFNPSRNQQDDGTSSLVSIALITIGMGALLWHRYRPEIPIEERRIRIKKELKAPRITPTQTLDSIDPPTGNRDPEDNFFSCSPARTKVLHGMVAHIITKKKLEKNTGVIVAHARQTIEKFLKEKDQPSVDFRKYLRAYAFEVFAHLFSGSKHRKYMGNVASNRDALLDHIDPHCDENTFLGFMRSRENEFSPAQTRRIMSSLLIGMEATIGDTIIVCLNLWATHPEEFASLTMIQEPELLIKEINKHILESLRILPPPATRRPKGMDLNDFTDHEEIVGRKFKQFHPQRYEDKKIFIERQVEVWRRAPWMPFSIGPNSCPGDQFAQTVITIFVTVLITEYEFSVAGSNDRYPREVRGFHLRRR